MKPTNTNIAPAQDRSIYIPRVGGFKSDTEPTNKLIEINISEKISKVSKSTTDPSKTEMACS